MFLAHFEGPPETLLGFKNGEKKNTNWKLIIASENLLELSRGIAFPN